eukprot:1158855-Pelagomonas_calceolata.AAC.1
MDIIRGNRHPPVLPCCSLCCFSLKVAKRGLLKSRGPRACAQENFEWELSRGQKTPISLAVMQPLLLQLGERQGRAASYEQDEQR